MKKLLLLAASFLFASQFAQAQSTQLGTFDCGTSFTIPYTTFYFEVGSGVTSFATITTDISHFQELFIYATTGKHLLTCQVGGGQQPNSQTLHFTETIVQLVSVTASAGTQYVTATFNFQKVEDVTAPASPAANAANPLTPEQQNKALTEFLARAPKPGKN